MQTPPTPSLNGSARTRPMGSVAPANPQRRRAGLTLVELLAVVGIMALFALSLRPGLRPANEQALERGAHEIAEAIRFARSEAIRTGDAYGVDLETANGRVLPFRANRTTSPPSAIYDVTHPLTKQDYVVDLTSPGRIQNLALSGSISHLATCDAPNRIVFDGATAPRCGDPWTALVASGTIRLELDGAERIITIDGETGRTSVQ